MAHSSPKASQLSRRSQRFLEDVRELVVAKHRWERAVLTLTRGVGMRRKIINKSFVQSNLRGTPAKSAEEVEEVANKAVEPFTLKLGTILKSLGVDPEEIMGDRKCLAIGRAEKRDSINQPVFSCRIILKTQQERKELDELLSNSFECVEQEDRVMFPSFSSHYKVEMPFGVTNHIFGIDVKFFSLIAAEEQASKYLQKLDDFLENYSSIRADPVFQLKTDEMLSAVFAGPALAPLKKLGEYFAYLEEDSAYDLFLNRMFELVDKHKYEDLFPQEVGSSKISRSLETITPIEASRRASAKERRSIVKLICTTAKLKTFSREETKRNGLTRIEILERIRTLLLSNQLYGNKPNIIQKEDDDDDDDDDDDVLPVSSSAWINKRPVLTAAQNDLRALLKSSHTKGADQSLSALLALVSHIRAIVDDLACIPLEQQQDLLSIATSLQSDVIKMQKSWDLEKHTSEVNQIAQNFFLNLQLVGKDEANALLITREPETTIFGRDVKAFASFIGIVDTMQDIYDDPDTYDPCITVAQQLVAGIESGKSLVDLGFNSAAILRMGSPTTEATMLDAVLLTCEAVPMTVCHLPAMSPGVNQIQVTDSDGKTSELLAYKIDGVPGEDWKFPELRTEQSSASAEEMAGEQMETWFHACRFPALVNIAIHGIDESKVGAVPRTDFARDGAFYLNPSATQSEFGALSWCVKLAAQGGVDDFAIICFKVAKSKLESLPGRKFILQNAVDEKEVSRLVKYCRGNHQKPAEREYFQNNYDRPQMKWIRGPMVTNPGEMMRAKKAVPNFAHEQLALRHVDASVLFNNGLVGCVVFSPEAIEGLVSRFKSQSKGPPGETMDQWRERRDKNQSKIAEGRTETAEAQNIGSTSTVREPEESKDEGSAPIVERGSDVANEKNTAQDDKNDVVACPIQENLPELATIHVNEQ